MEEVWRELIRAVPWGTVIIILRWLDIKEKTEERISRENNAKDKSIADRESQQIVAKAYADAINALAKVTEMSSNNIVKSIGEFRETVLEQYKNMGITQELIDVYKTRILADEEKQGKRR